MNLLSTFESLTGLYKEHVRAQDVFMAFCVRYDIAGRAKRAKTPDERKKVFTPAWRRRLDKMNETSTAYCDAYNAIVDALS